MKNKKNTLIIILLLILLGFAIAYIVLGPNGYKSLQANLSYYVGASYSDAFGVYSKDEILLGKTVDGEQIKDNQDNLLPTLVDEATAEDYDGESKAYKLNMEYVETTLGIDIDDYDGVSFYVVDGDFVKVKLDGEPEWWNNNYDNLILK